MEDARWILESHINGLHQELAALTAERDKAVAKLDRLCEAVLYTTELYREPLRYTTSKAKLKPNLSTGFETRYQAMYDLARALLTEEGKP